MLKAHLVVFMLFMGIFCATPQVFAEDCARAISKLVLGAEKQNLPRATRAEFKKLSTEKKEELLRNVADSDTSSHLSGVVRISLNDGADIDKIFHKPYRDAFKDLREKLLNDVDAEEIEQASFGVIDEVEIMQAYLVVAEDTKEILGYGGSVLRKGFEYEDTSLNSSYATVEAAAKAGADMGADINWQAHIVADFEGNILGEARYEWSGW